MAGDARSVTVREFICSRAPPCSHFRSICSEEAKDMIDGTGYDRDPVRFHVHTIFRFAWIPYVNANRYAIFNNYRIKSGHAPDAQLSFAQPVYLQGLVVQRPVLALHLVAGALLGGGVGRPREDGGVVLQAVRGGVLGAGEHLPPATETERGERGGGGGVWLTRGVRAPPSL